MATKTRQELYALVDSDMPDNNLGLITPAITRGILDEVIESCPNVEDDTIVSSVVAGTPNVSVDLSNPEQPSISVTQTTAGLFTNVYFTADQETTTEGTFYLTQVGSKGTALEAIQNLTIGTSDGPTPFGQDFLSVPAVSDSIIAPGAYAGFPLISLGGNDGKVRLRIEVYITDGDGVPIAKSGPLGSLGVNTMLIADSGIKDIQANRETSLGMTGSLQNSVDWLTGQRVRYRVLAEKVGGNTSDQTFSLFSGADYESFFQIPTPASDVVTVAPTSIVTFALAGQIPTTPTVMRTDTAFTTGASGIYSGNISGAHIIGVKYTMSVFGAGPGATVDIDVQAEPQGAGSEHQPGGGTNILSQNLITTVTATAPAYNKGGEFSFAPIPLTQDTVFFIDVTANSQASITNLRVSLIVEYQDLAESRRL
jgi:hypothetical protein